MQSSGSIKLKIPFLNRLMNNTTVLSALCNDFILLKPLSSNADDLTGAERSCKLLGEIINISKSTSKSTDSEAFSTKELEYQLAYSFQPINVFDINFLILSGDKLEALITLLDTIIQNSRYNVILQIFLLLIQKSVSNKRIISENYADLFVSKLKKQIRDQPLDVHFHLLVEIISFDCKPSRLFDYGKPCFDTVDYRILMELAKYNPEDSHLIFKKTNLSIDYKAKGKSVTILADVGLFQPNISTHLFTISTMFSGNNEISIGLVDSGLTVTTPDKETTEDYDFLPNIVYSFGIAYDHTCGSVFVYINGDLITVHSVSLKLKSVSISIGSQKNESFVKLYRFQVFDEPLNEQALKDLFHKRLNHNILQKPNHTLNNSKDILPNCFFSAKDYYQSHNHSVISLLQSPPNESKLMYYPTIGPTQAMIKAGVFNHIISTFSSGTPVDFFQVQLPLFLNQFLQNSFLKSRFVEYDGYSLLSFLISSHISTYENKNGVLLMLFNHMKKNNELTGMLLSQLIIPILSWNSTDHSTINLFFTELLLCCDPVSKHGISVIQEMEQTNSIPQLLFLLTHSTESINHFQDSLAAFLKNLLDHSSTSKSFNAIFFFVYYSIKFQKNNVLATFLLKTLDNVFFEALTTLNKPLLRTIEKNVNLKNLLMLANVSTQQCQESDVPLHALSVLLKYLQLNTACRNSFENDGCSILFSIVQNFNTNHFAAVIKMMYAASSGNTVCVDKTLAKNDFSLCNVDFLGENMELHLLVIRLLLANRLHDTLLFSQYIDDLSRLKNENRQLEISLTKDTRVYVSLVESLLFVSNPELESKITTLLSETFLAMMSQKHCNFLLFLKSMGMAVSLNDHKDINSMNSFLHIKITPHILETLAIVIEESYFVVQQETQDYLKNARTLIVSAGATLPKIKWEIQNLIQFFKTTLAVIELEKTNDTHNHKELKDLGLVLMNSIICLLNNEINAENTKYYNDMFKLCLKYQDVLFRVDQACAIDEHLTYFLLSFIARNSTTTTEDCVFSLSCFRTITLHRRSSLKKFTKALLKISRDFPLDFFAAALSADDDELAALFEKHQSTFALYFTQGFQRTFMPNSLLSSSENFVLKTIDQMETNLSLCLRESQQKDFKCSLELQQLFQKDSTLLENKMISTECKRQRDIAEDQEESALFYRQKVSKIEFGTKVLLACYSTSTPAAALQWYVSPNSTTDLMKKTLCVELTPTIESNGILNVFANAEKPKNEDSLSQINSNLQTCDINTDVSNKNRKVLKNLLPNEHIMSIWNTSLVIGLKIEEGLFILGERHCYFITNFYFSEKDRKVLEISEVEDKDRDDIIQLITGEDLAQHSSSVSHETTQFATNQIANIVKRPFLLRDLAVEIIIQSRASFFFSFKTKDRRNIFYNEMVTRQNPRLLEDNLLRSVYSYMDSQNESVTVKNGISSGSLAWKLTSAVQGFTESNTLKVITEKWQCGEISNFFYLVIVNLLAGRSFNDLTQYPVFPWVLSDYTSDSLDLGDPSTFRDFSKPMGAQTKVRAEQFIERYSALQEMGDPNIPPFHYGTHYSSAMIVTSYLIRLEPFTSSYLVLQGNKLGPPDRLFNSVERAWNSCSKELSTDVRELTPEFFYLPEFLTNINKMDFGTLQDGSRVDAVELPPWAQNDPTVFIHKNREALESEYVSQNLHKWVDLIFGCKQRGPQAVQAVNVFNQMSYPGMVNLENVHDMREKRTITSIIHNFGQTPLQIFEKPHARKHSKLQNPTDVYIPDTSTKKKIEFDSHLHGIRRIDWEISDSGDKIWNAGPMSSLKLNKIRTIASADSKLWCNDILVMQNDVDFTAFCKIDHRSFVTGDLFGQIIVWKIEKGRTLVDHTLHGHVHAIKTILVSPENNALVSLDESGVSLHWDLFSGELVSGICKDLKLDNLALSNNSGNIAVVENKVIHVVNINKMILTKMDLPQTPTSLVFLEGSRSHRFYPFGDILVIGYASGTIDVYMLTLEEEVGWCLMLLKTLATGANSKITALAGRYQKGEKKKECAVEICAGDSDSFLYIWE